MLDLHGEYALIRDRVRAAVDRVLESQHFIGGPAIAELEQAMVNRLGIPEAVAISNGTDALLCAMMAAGVGHGDEVIVPPFTFFATAGCVHRLGARPVFVDIDPHTFCIDPSLIQAAVTPRTRCIMPVHLYGLCADMDPIMEIARGRGLTVIEDACQAVGATYKGRPAGGIGDLGTLSFYPTKNLGGFGEGGMILTQQADLAAKCRQLRNHGQSRLYLHDIIGGNFRLDSLKAAILLVKLDHFDEFTRRRRENASLYDALLRGAPVQTPDTPPGREHVYHQYTVRCDRRDDLAAHLKAQSIGSAVYYPVPLHRQPCFGYLNIPEGAFPAAEEASRRVLSLPVHPMLTNPDIERVASAIHEFYGTRPA